MRKFILTIYLNIAILCSAYNLNNVIEALHELENGNISEAVTQLMQKSATNDVVAQFYIGQCYEHGIGMEVDPQQAFLMYRRTAERGFAPAMLMLARCYEEGFGVAPNPARADEWMSRYAKRAEVSTIPDICKILYASVKGDDEKIASHDTDNSDVEKPVPLAQTYPMTPPQPAQTPPAQTYVVPNIAERSDVDIDIPKSHDEKTAVFALIIANEVYQDVAPVPNAINDGEIMAKYCSRTLGLPESNIHLVKNATLNNIKREINIMTKIAEAYKGEAAFIVYYAGHGIPDESTRDAFMLPVDGYTADISTCYRLSDFYASLGNMPSRKTIVFIDACFSGASRDGKNMLASARGVAIKAKPSVPQGNMVVITSASADETAYPYNEKRHGLFTYYLLKKIKDTKGKASVGDLADYIIDNVTKKSIVVNGKTQTPSAIPAQTVGNEWKNWILN